MVNKLKEMPVNITARIPELYELKERRELNLEKIIVSNFFTQRRREMRKRASCRKSDSDDRLSDRDTEGSHVTLYKSARKL